MKVCSTSQRLHCWWSLILLAWFATTSCYLGGPLVSITGASVTTINETLVPIHSLLCACEMNRFVWLIPQSNEKQSPFLMTTVAMPVFSTKNETVSLCPFRLEVQPSVCAIATVQLSLSTEKQGCPPRCGWHWYSSPRTAKSYSQAQGTNVSLCLCKLVARSFIYHQSLIFLE